MEKFLEFINTASIKELNSILGIKTAAGKKVAAARPYNSLEELTASSGLSLEALNGIASNYETTTVVEAESEPEVQVETPQEEAAQSIEIEQAESAEKPRRSGTRIAFKVFLWLLLLAAIAAGFYYGIPFFKEKILNPLEANTSQVGELTSKQQQDVAALQQKITELQNQISTLDARASSAEETLGAYAKTLTAQESGITALTDALTAARAELNDMDSALAAQVAEQQLLSRALQLLSRARLYLSQSNFGMAREDVAAARSLLFSSLDTISAEKEAGLRMAIERLDFALVNLPAYPVVAVYDLDIAWQLLVDNLPAAPELVTTPAVYATETPLAATPIPDVTATPTAEATETPLP